MAEGKFKMFGSACRLSDLVWSSEEQRPNYCGMSYSWNNGSLSFNFKKGTSGGNKESSDAWCVLSPQASWNFVNAVIGLLKKRISQFENGQNYSDGFNLSYEMKFYDSENQTERLSGTLSLRTQPDSNGRISVYVIYNNNVTEFKICLCDNFGKSKFVSTDGVTVIDYCDAPFIAFAKTISSAFLKNYDVHMHIMSSTNMIMKAINELKGGSSGGSSSGGYGGDSSAEDEPF